MNVGHAVNKTWTDSTIQNSRQAFIEGLSTGLKSPTGLGPRFALVHAGDDNGFVSGAEYTFLCKKNTADVHHEMDSETYEDWFINKLLPNIPQHSVIVLDNASYHCRKLENIHFLRATQSKYNFTHFVAFRKNVYTYIFCNLFVYMKIYLTKKLIKSMKICVRLLDNFWN